MQNNQEHLDIDFGFLDKALRRDAEMAAESAYKYNWRNIIVIGGIIAGLIIWGAMSSNTSSSHQVPTSYAPPSTNVNTSVTNGQFRCSSYDSSQADALLPTNEFVINKESEDLQRRADELNTLKANINTSAVNQSSPQYLIDNYNRMIDTYSSKLTVFKSDSTLHHQKVETFNAQVEAHNNYLTAHCRKAY